MSESAERIRSCIDRIVRIRGEIEGLNGDIADIYRQAKAEGFDKKAMQICVRWALKDCRQGDEELSQIAELYWSQYNTTRAGVRAREAA